MKSKTYLSGFEKDIVVILLSITSASVDAIGFLMFGHVFTANMTGNTILIVLAISRANLHQALLPFVALAGFAIGIIMGESILLSFRGSVQTLLHKSSRNAQISPSRSSQQATEKNPSSSPQNPSQNSTNGSSRDSSRGESQNTQQNTSQELQQSSSQKSSQSSLQASDSILIFPLTIESILLIILFISWAFIGKTPSNIFYYPLIGLSAFSMGIQSAAIGYVKVTGITTTYITGTIADMMVDLTETLQGLLFHRKVESGNTQNSRERKNSSLFVASWLVYVLGAIIAGVTSVNIHYFSLLIPIITLIITIFYIFGSS